MSKKINKISAIFVDEKKAKIDKMYKMFNYFKYRVKIYIYKYLPIYNYMMNKTQINLNIIQKIPMK